MPLPVSAIERGLPNAESVMLTEAIRVPVAVGLNVTLMMQLDVGPVPVGSVAGSVPQVFVCAKSPACAPAMPIALIVSGPVPVLVSVAVLTPLVVDTFWLPKSSAAGARLTMGAVPLPLSGIVCGLPVAESAMDSVADFSSAGTFGLNVTLMVQLAPGARVVTPPQVVAVKEGIFVPVIVIELIVSAPVPVFFNVTGLLGLVVPTNWSPKSSAVGARFAAGAVPLPVSATVCGTLAAEWLIVIVATRVPVAVGLNFTVIVQLALGPVPTGTVAGGIGQEFSWLKSPAFSPVIVMELTVSSAVPGFDTVTT